MRARWGQLPLRVQLTAVFTVLLVVGLMLTGVTAQSFLRRSLVEQVDAQLAQAAQELVEPGRIHDDLGGPRELPTDYQWVFSATDGDPLVPSPSSTATTATARFPELTAAEITALGGRGFTVGSREGEAVRWRVLVKNVTSGGEVIGSVSVALPLTAAEATLRKMRLVLVAIGLGVVALGVGAGSWGVRRSLRHLDEIEDTAAAIAAGDLTRRVPDMPPTTEVGRLAVALNGMLAQIEQAFAVRTASERRMRQFVADASHELRTPLATIRGYGELYRMGALTTKEEVDTTVRRMEDSATRMGSLVEDLLHLARLDENRPLHRDPVDLAVLAADAAADLRALDPTRPVRLEGISGTTAGAVVTGDEGRLRQVLANLVGNVVRHTPAGTPAEIVVGREGNHAVVLVRDHGPGIDPEHAARVFERFYRVDASRGRAQGGGAGLGMAIVQAIVVAHGGVVDLAQTPGGGTTVAVRLPAPGPAAGPPPPPAAPGAVATPPG